MKLSRIRISQLHRDKADREAAFSRSRSALERNVRERLRPMNFIREHPGLIAGAAMSAFSFLGLRKPARLNGYANGARRRGRAAGIAGALLRTFSFGGGIAARTLTPIAGTALRFAFKTILKKFRGR